MSLQRTVEVVVGEDEDTFLGLDLGQTGGKDRRQEQQQREGVHLGERA